MKKIKEMTTEELQEQLSILDKFELDDVEDLKNRVKAEIKERERIEKEKKEEEERKKQESEFITQHCDNTKLLKKQISVLGHYFKNNMKSYYKVTGVLGEKAICETFYAGKDYQFKTSGMEVKIDELLSDKFYEITEKEYYLKSKEVQIKHSCPENDDLLLGYGINKALDRFINAII